MRLRAPLVLLTAIVGIACEEPTGLSPELATYVARTVNGEPVPAPLRKNASFELLVIADTVRFGLFGLAEWTQVRRTTVEGVAREVEVTRAEASYHVRGDSVFFSFPCPPDADCLPPPFGVFSADRRHLLVHLPLGDDSLGYERTSP